MAVRGFSSSAPTKYGPVEITGGATCHGEALFGMKSALVASGSWTIVASGDGTTFSLVGDVIDDATKAQAIGAWFVMESVHDGQQFCVEHISAGNMSHYRIKHSRAAGFTGGTPSATQVPSATDEVIILGGGTDGAPTGGTWFNNWGSTGSDVRPLYGMVDGASSAFYFSQQLATAGGLTGSMQWFVDPIASPHATDDYPYVFGAGGGTTWNIGTFSSGTEGSNLQWAYFWDGASWTGRRVAAGQIYFGTFSVPDNLESDGITGFPQLFAFLWGRQDNWVGGRYARGRSSLFLLIGTNYGIPYKRVFDDGAAAAGLISLGEQVVAGWDGTVPDLAAAGAWTDVGETTIFEYTVTVLPSAPAAAGLIPAGGIGLG